METDLGLRVWMRECLEDAEDIFGLEFCDKWIGALFSNKNCVSVMALLLVLLSDHVETLHFSDYWKGTNDELLYTDAAIYLGNFLKDIDDDDNPQTYFSKLHKVILQYEDIDTLKDRAGPSCFGYLQLPSIREFQADMLINPRSPKFENSVVTDVRLTRCNLSDNTRFETCRSFLSCFKLRTFTYEHLASVRFP